jgi:hypothetical protein
MLAQSFLALFSSLVINATSEYPLEREPFFDTVLENEQSSSEANERAFINNCAEHPEPYVDVKLEMERPNLFTNKSEEYIAGLIKKTNSTDNPYKEFEEEQYIGSGIYISVGIPGLTVFKTELKAESSMTRMPGLCHQLSVIFKIDAPMDVYIANSMERGGCQYIATLRHEEKHVILGRRILRYYRDIIEDDLTKALANFISANENKLFPIDTKDKMKVVFDQFLEEKVQEYTKKISTYMLAEQQKLDTHEEYKKVRKECTHLNKYKFLKKYNEDQERNAR